jgi:hypothetical protein
MRRNLGIAIAIGHALALVVSNFTLAAGRDNPKGDDRDHVQTIQLTATSFPTKTSTSTRPG